MSKVMTSAAEAIADIEDGASVGIAGFGLSHRYPSTLISALGEKGTQRADRLLQRARPARVPDRSRARGKPSDRAPGHLLLRAARGGLRGREADRRRGDDAGDGPAGDAGRADAGRRRGTRRDLHADRLRLRDRRGQGHQVLRRAPLRARAGHHHGLRADQGGSKADHFGNVVFRGGSQNFNVSFAKAARVTIVEAEEIVDDRGDRAGGRGPAWRVRHPGGADHRADGHQNLPKRANRPPASAKSTSASPR